MSVEAVAAVLARHDHVSVVPHQQADADALGSAIGLATTVAADADTVLPDGLAQGGCRLADGLDVTLTDVDSWTPPSDTVVVAVDTPSTARLPGLDVGTVDAPLVVIDHHEPGDLSALATAEYRSTAAGATAALVPTVAAALDRPLPPTGAIGLAVGLYADTQGLAGAAKSELQCFGECVATAGSRAGEIPPLLRSRSPGFSRRMAGVKAVVRADGFRAGETLALVTTVGGEQSAVATALRSAGADYAFVVSDRDAETWVVGRSREETAPLQSVLDPLVERFGGQSGGHPEAAVAKLQTTETEAVRAAVRDHLATVLDESLTELS